MLQVDYRFEPEAQNPYARDNKQEVKDLFSDLLNIRDFCTRTRYALPPREGQSAEVASALAELAAHEKWWPRLFVARLIFEEPELRTPELVEKLRADSNPQVKSAMDDYAASTNP